MRVAFVGGTRFIGHAAAARAVARGHDVALLHRGAHPSEVAGAREVLVDRDDGAALRAALAGVRPDVVVDTRAMTRRDAETCAAACAALGAPAVVLSSQDVYAQFGALNGHPAPRVDAEVAEGAPLTVPYPFRGVAPHDGGEDYDKKDVEAAYARALDAVTVLRLPAVYGRRDPRRRFGAVVDALDAARAAGRAACELPCRRGASFRWTHAHVDDAAHAIVLAAEARPASRAVFNVGERDAPTMRARAEALARVVGVGIAWREVEAEIDGALGIFDAAANDFVASTAAIRAVLGYDDVTTEAERLADVVAWARASRA